ncbi:hypothetical protein ACFU6R_09475 [Streptomyces sp. NPDC057499]|uniref:hypothetical protein n=1 Tax=Streptomyces sp. NPDC057499 TaxID=3346150 RepID=UPI0036D0B9FB
MAHALAEALIDVLWFVDGSEDGQMDPDDAVEVMERAAHAVGALPKDQREQLVGMVGEMAAVEPDPARRVFLEEFPESFALVDGAL